MTTKTKTKTDSKATTKTTKAKKAPEKTRSGTVKKAKTMTTTPIPRSSADKPKKRPPTSHKLVWRHVTARVRHTPNYINRGWSHIELVVLTPKEAPLPITRTGYLSHFLDEKELAKAGGPVAFFAAWLDREARTPAWAKTDFKWRQLELFPR
jgi:hypothetical protein